MDIKQLNRLYGIPGHIEFIEGKGNLIIAKVSNNQAEAVISLYGAHILSFHPKDQKDILWMSPQSLFEKGKPIRGGIPVCFPWFGPNPEDGEKPLHGCARLSDWEVLKTSSLNLEDDETILVLGLKSNAYTLAMWPFDFSAEMVIKIGKKLDVTLSYTNTGTNTFTATNALHSYFSVSDTGTIGISGLKGSHYYDHTVFAKEANTVQEEKILKISKQEDRIYINQSDDCLITDPGWKRSIRVEKRNSKATVVWNPWTESVKRMNDIPDEDYKSFVCVEAVNAYDDTITLKPGEKHQLSTIISIE